MKKAILTLAIIGLAISSRAQDNNDTTKFANWVVESNVNTPKEHTIKFYDNEQKLIYEEKVTGKLDVKKRSVQKTLNQLLGVLLYQKDNIANKKILASTLNVKH